MPNWKKLIVSGSSANLSNLNVDNAVTASYFKGDGSALTGVTSTVVETATVTSSFSNVSSVSVTHNFGTKDVIVSTYLSDDTLFYPASITTTNTSSVDITFGSNRTGRVVVAKGGHVVQGSIVGDVDFSNLTNTPTLLSSSNQIASEISGSFTSLSGSIASRFDGLTSDYTELTNIPSGIISSSAQFNALSNTSASYALTSSYSENFSATGSITINGYTLPLTDGVDGQTIITDGDGVLTFDDVKIYTTVKNISGATLVKGTPVHATASASPPPGNLSEVVAASASLASSMPATFILNEDLIDGAEGSAISVGYISGVNTSGFTVGDIVYVGPNGGYTNIKPTGTNLIQNLGVVTKVDASNGSGFIYGSGRSNDVPNILQGYAWVGNENGVATALPTSSFYVTNALSASYALSSSHEITFELSSSHAETADVAPFSGLTGLPTLVSGSEQISYTGITNVPSGIISSSTQFNALSDTTSSYALTASYALNAGGGSGAGFPFSGSAVITGSLYVSGSTISGSFAGDGSGLTGITISEFATVEDTFTNAPSHSVVHNFGTKNVFVQVFEDDDTLLIPFSVTTTTINQVDIVFGDTLSGRVVIGKAGHIISGSLSNAISSSYATTASYIQASGVDGTVANATTASFAVTASYAENAGGGNVTGSFTNVTSSIVTHNFGTKAVIVQVYDTNDYVINPSSIRANTVNQVTVTFSTPESGIIVVGS